MPEDPEYLKFLESKRLVVPNNGRQVSDDDINPILFPFQRDIVRWACAKGRCAIFADTGLGKTFMQLEWARLIGGECLIVAPLCVAKQTQAEGLKIGTRVTYARSTRGMATGINITNYEMIEEFDPSRFRMVILDESSILKGIAGKTRKILNQMFAQMSYRLCCTATPAPNDIAEIANHAEFLGIMTRADMLSSFFVHDSNGRIQEGWRLKQHATEAFYRWLASWGMSVKRPSDLGHSDEGFVLPPLSVKPVFVETDYRPEGLLFHGKLKGIQDRSKVRRNTIEEKIEYLANLINTDTEQWIIWCGLNEEGRKIADRIDDSTLVEGSQSIEEKTSAIQQFLLGVGRVLVTKGSINGFGMNFQHCHKMAFLGLSDSWEAYYQQIRRCYRFGQQNPVETYIILSEAERDIYDNVMRKEAEAQVMSENLIKHVAKFEREEIGQQEEIQVMEPQEKTGEDWRMIHGDSTSVLKSIESESIDLSIFSPPFLSLYAYSPTERDLGNSRTMEQFFEHFALIIEELLRVTKPGRNVCVHVAQVPRTIVSDGWIGIRDFRGDVIRAFEAKQFVYHGEVCIDKDPQAQAIRTHAKGLLFVQLWRDASWLRQALADYILIFRKPGENAVPIIPDITNEDWIKWARPVWYGIKETDTLNGRLARDEKDERHICPLQLETIERCVRLWSNPGELVLSPFAGIGSEGFVALRQKRGFLGIELKESYWRVACENLRQAKITAQGELFKEVNAIST